MLLPTSLTGAAMMTQRAHDLAELDITGGLLKTGHLSKDDDKNIERLRTELLEHEKRRIEAMRGTPEGDASALKYHLDYAKVVSGYAEFPLGAYGFIEWFAAHITGTWTAIEAMLGDLWEESLNYHPKILAGLTGKPDRITSHTKQEKPEQQLHRQAGEKEVPLLQIELAEFDIKNKMGTIFRRQRRFEFSRLSSIKEAYSRAFKEKSGRIDSALSSKSIESLSAVRNVIVHKAGHADQQYVKQCSFLDIPKAELGQPVLLDGDSVAKLIKGAFDSSKALLIGVDEWLQEN